MAESAEVIFKKAGAVLEGHFLLTSGLHSPIYWEKFQVLQFPQFTQRLCSMIARHFCEIGVQVVAGPTTGGIILAHEVARQLKARSIFAEREGVSDHTFRRGFRLDPGECVLVVDDVLTTGGSIREVMGAVNKLGGKVVGVGVLVDRSLPQAEFGVPLFSCLRSETMTYTPEKCPLCAAHVPLIKPGSSSKRAS